MSKEKEGLDARAIPQGKRHTASAGDPRHGSSMACTTVYTHIGLLTSKGLAQREEWRRRMEEKEVNNGWSQYGLRIVTDVKPLCLSDLAFMAGLIIPFDIIDKHGPPEMQQ
jgi:hypothetical protein